MHWPEVVSVKSTVADFFVRPSYWDKVENMCLQYARKYHTGIQESMVGSWGSKFTYTILDGNAIRNRVFGGSPGLWINGTKVLRFILYLMNASQPGLFRGETRIPDLTELYHQARRESFQTEIEREEREEWLSEERLALKELYTAQPESGRRDREYCKKSSELRIVFPGKFVGSPVTAHTDYYFNVSLEGAKEILSQPTIDENLMDRLMQKALDYPDDKYLKLLLGHGLDPDFRPFTEKGSILIWAIKNRRLDLIRLLIRRGANPRKRFAIWRGAYITPIGEAVKTGRQDIIGEIRRGLFTA